MLDINESMSFIGNKKNKSYLGSHKIWGEDIFVLQYFRRFRVGTNVQSCASC